MKKEVATIFVIVTAIKFLLVPCYRSTDFEVHRNWLAVTHSLPLKQWYYDATSEWTLDYPPFFAWFEYCLSHAAVLFDTNMLKVENLGYASPETVLFQRFSVIVCDLFLLYSIVKYCETWPSRNSFGVGIGEATSKSKYLAVLVITLANPGLLIVDHIHFQYNGFLLALLILSITYIKRGDDLTGGILYAILLNFKHVFIYIAPVYFVYLLRNYCFIPTTPHYDGWEQFDKSEKQQTRKWSTFNFLRLGFSVILVFAVSFAPFLYFGIDQLFQIRSRLFPFGNRGLTHAYWAPNIWALYNFADIVLGFLLQQKNNSMTRGLVQNISHSVLPDITPGVTLVLTMACMAPVLISLWRRPHPRLFLPAVVYCMMCSFMCGWHVHEKAILMVVVPLGLLALDSVREWNLYFLLSLAGHYSLFPLLQDGKETLIKVLLLAFHSTVTRQITRPGLVNKELKSHMEVTGWSGTLQSLYTSGFVLLFIFTNFVIPFCWPSLQFLPLMLSSLYCSIGTFWGWYECLVVYWKVHKQLS